MKKIVLLMFAISSVSIFGQHLTNIIPAFQIKDPASMLDLWTTHCVSSDGNYALIMEHQPNLLESTNKPIFGVVWDLKNKEVYSIINDNILEGFNVSNTGVGFSHDDKKIYLFAKKKDESYTYLIKWNIENKQFEEPLKLNHHRVRVKKFINLDDERIVMTFDHNLLSSYIFCASVITGEILWKKQFEAGPGEGFLSIDKTESGFLTIQNNYSDANLLTLVHWDSDYHEIKHYNLPDTIHGLTTMDLKYHNGKVYIDQIILQFKSYIVEYSLDFEKIAAFIPGKSDESGYQIDKKRNRLVMPSGYSLNIYNLDNLNIFKSIPTDVNEKIYNCFFSGDSTIIYYTKNTVRECNLHSQKSLYLSLPSGTKMRDIISFNNSNKFIYQISNEVWGSFHKLFVFDIERREVVAEADLDFYYNGRYDYTNLSSDDKYILIADNKNSLTVLNSYDLSVEKRIVIGDVDEINYAAFSKESYDILAACSDSTLRLLDYKTLGEKFRKKTIKEPVYINWYNSNTLLYSYYSDQSHNYSFRIYNLETNEENFVKSVYAYNKYTSEFPFEYRTYDSVLFFCQYDYLKKQNLNSTNAVKVIDNEYTSKTINLSKDGRFVILYNFLRRINIIDRKNDEIILDFKQSPFYDYLNDLATTDTRCQLSYDNKYIIVHESYRSDVTPAIYIYDMKGITSVEENYPQSREDGIIVSPNPVVHDEFNIEFADGSIPLETELYLYDIMGNKLAQWQISNKKQALHINKTIADGFYYLRISNKDKTSIKKLIINRR